MIHVIAQIDLAPGKRSRFLAELQQIVPLVLAETGCIEYGAAVDASTDLERQHRSPDRVTIIEKWDTIHHLQDHLAAPHMLTYREQVSDMIITAQLNILTPA